MGPNTLSAYYYYCSKFISDSGIYYNGIFIKGKNLLLYYKSYGDLLLNKSKILSNGSLYFSPFDVLWIESNNDYVKYS